MSQKEFMLKRREAIQASKAVSSRERHEILERIGQMEVYVSCLDCEAFNPDTDYCNEYKQTVDIYVQVYGCGNGYEPIPF